MIKTLCALSVLTVAAASVTRADEATETFFYRTNTPNKSNATVGRWLYTGTVPRFDAKNLEIFVSKVGLTARVHAWVPAGMPESYGEYLLARYKRIQAAFANDGVYFENLQSVDELLAKASESEKAWLQIDAPYLKHELDGHGADVFSAKDKASYKKEVMTALARSFLDDESMTVAKMLDFANRAEAGDQAFLSEFRVKVSKPLFEKRFGSQFTPVSGSGTKFNGSKIDGVVGTLDFVYPIAATVDGPFSIPSEGVKKFPIDGTIEARWWSDKWGDEYGGLPFLMFTTSAIAFHGPITHNKSMDIWFVKRDFASHGCHRMNASDVMELRALMPSDAVKKSAGEIPVYIQTWMDVIEKDGKKQVVDVAYYEVPDSVAAKDVARFKGDAARAEWQKKHYTKYDNQVDNSKESFDPRGEQFFGLPKYSVQGGELKRSDFYKDGIPVHTFPYHAVKVIQYREDGTKLSGYNDSAGKYPPGYFELP